MTIPDFKTLIAGATKTVVVEIGPWDMDTNHFISIGITIPILKIRGVSVIIRDDADLMYCDFLSVQDGTAVTVPQIQIQTGSIKLTRRTGSLFNDYVKTSGSYNRGWLTITYVE
jgi:hypothetical protein